MSIVMTGGGTGGHLAIIKAVKEELTDQDLVYIGSTRGQDRAWFEADEAFKSCYFLSTQGVVNQGFFGKVKSLWMLLRATLEARKILKKEQAKVVFCVGGFSAAPTSFAAKILGIPLVIHEQNATMGSLNRLLRPYAKAFISSYDMQSAIRAYPIKQEFFERARIRSKVETIIFLGGSQGARAINRLALDLAPMLKERGIKIIHQAGEKNIQEVRQSYRDIGIEAEVFGFTTELARFMEQADFAVARAGASTLWELAAIACPTLFVPYPYAAGDHQYHNAKFLEEQGAAWILREGELSTSKVLSMLDEDMSSRSKKLQSLVERDGSRKIADLLLKIAKE